MKISDVVAISFDNKTTSQLKEFGTAFCVFLFWPRGKLTLN